MRKWMKTLLLASVFAFLLCGSALAADSGIYGIQGTGSVASSLTPELADKSTAPTATAPEGVSGLFYSGAVQLGMEVANPQDGKEYLVFVLKGDTTQPSETNIVYINQETGAAGLTFHLYPSSLENGTVYTVCLSSTGTGLQKAGSFRYYAAYKLGDVNEDGAIDVSDALQVLNHYVGNITLSGSKLSAAEVTNDGAVDVSDALKILNFYVGNIVSFQ